jgi:hypothetical protein
MLIVQHVFLTNEKKKSVAYTEKKLYIQYKKNFFLNFFFHNIATVNFMNY